MDRHTRFAWRKASFGRIRQVPPTEARRWRHERRPTATALCRTWTMDEVDRAIDLLDQGYNYTEIAHILKRSHLAVQMKVKRLGCQMTRRPTVLSCHQIAALLGRSCSKSVSKWIQRDWLPARVAVCNGRHIWRVQWDHLMLFLHQRQYWMAWDVAQVVDRDLRAELLAVREQAGGRWLTPREVAARYHVESATVNQWIHKRLLPAQRYGNHWIWSGDLDGWIVPCERSRSGRRQHAHP